ncbi:MAG: GHMP kinase [Anaerolineae bacterium]|nr:GHMP kinase [Anaerolineae bacterium]
MLEYHVKGVEVVTIADVPGSGTGLGSSSSLTVGLVRALSGFLTPGTQFHPHDLAEKAFEIERGRCGYSVGRQDHFAAACGGLNYFRFEQDRTIVESLQLSEKLLRELQSHFVLLWTGGTRKAGELLEQQEKVLSARPEVAVEMRDIAVRMSNDLRNGVIENIGEMLDANWQRKKQLADGITNDWIDKKYNQAIEAGAEGGKLCGAGGGGFLLFYAPFGKKNALEKATGLRAINFEIEPKGSEILWQK